jgi:deoxycytidylate deaminase
VINLNWSGPSKPAIEILRSAAPEYVWERVEHEAIRSPMIRFKAGCIIYNPSTEKIIAKGCSHPDIQYSKILASVHAEAHAIHNNVHLPMDGCWAIVYTLNGRGGCAYTSRPCYSCAQSLYKSDIERVIYPERVAEGTWIVKTEHPEELISRAPEPTGIFARNQRIPA